MTFLGEIIELYLQLGNFLENLMPPLNNFNKETKNKASMLKMIYLAIFMLLPEV